MTPRNAVGSFVPILLASALAACGGSPGGAAGEGARAQVAVSASGVTVDVIATQTWQGGFNGAVRITDTAFASPISSFAVVFKMASGAVSGSAWNGTITGPDASGNYTATSPSWLSSGPIKAGQTWDVGFNGSGTLGATTIVSLTLNGQAVNLGSDAPPTVSLAASSTSVLATTSFTLTATAADDKGVAKVEFYDGTTLVGTTTAAPYALTIATTTAMIGAHSYTAKAYDTAGQTTVSSPVTVNVIGDIIPPPTVSLAASATSVTTAGCITLTATASSGAGIAKVEFYDGATLLGSKTATPYTQQACYTPASNGTHSYTAKAYDPSANVGTSTAVAVTVNIATTATAVSVNAGGAAVGSFLADQYFSGGTVATNTATNDISLITTNPPPASIFQSERYGAFTYTIPGMGAGAACSVTLYFSENYVSAAGQRLFSVAINGTTVLSNFDIYASAGGRNKGIARTFSATANSSGQVAIQFISGTQNPKVSGISVAPSGTTDNPPTISLASSATTVTTASTITLTATASDDHGVSKVVFSNGATSLCSVTAAPYTCAVPLISANNGTVTFTATAYDTANQTAAATAAVTVNIPTSTDNPPTVSLASSATSVTTASTITLTATATDDHGVAKVEFYDGATLLGSKTAAPYTWPVSFTVASNGTHAMTAKAYDTASQVTTSAAVNVVVNIPVPDTTAPTCSLAASPTALTAAGSLTLTVTASDNVGVTKVELYDAAALLASTTTSPWKWVLTLTATNNGTHSYGCKCYDAAGNTGTCPAQTVTVNIPTSTADATLTVDTSTNRKAISPYVYGYNAALLSGAPPGATFLRIGGNRWTAYNWTNNWSNAGSDWGPYSNDTFFGTASNGPGWGITPTIDNAKANNVAALVTIPIQGWVSQAKSGNVPLTDPVTSWFVPNVPAKGSAFTLTPSATSATVYQDELANFVANRWAGAVPHLSLDNEPDLWGYVTNGSGTGTHPEVQRTQLTYAAFLQQSVASAKAIKAAVPSALVYGPVSYGWNGMLSFQGAPDSTGATIDNSFLDYYLGQMSTASTSAGHRLLDVLDVHWYSEATSNGTGCTNTGVRVTNADNTDCVVAARVQAPRSLFDPTFVETSWITQYTTASSSLGAGIQLLPRLEAKIAAKYPGTRLSISEYNHGGEDHPSGAVAEADTLGIFGREGVYAAAFWSINSTTSWSYAAWKAYRNYDGSGHSFGDTSVSATTSDLSHVSVYASVDAASPNRLVMVIVHRPTLGTSGTLDLKTRTVQVNWSAATTLRTVRAWQLASGGSPAWQTLSVPAPTSNSLTLTLPALSVTTVELTP